MTSSAENTTYDVKKQKGLIQHMQKYPLYNQLHQHAVITHFISISMIRDYTIAWDVVKLFSHFQKGGDATGAAGYRLNLWSPELEI